MTSTVPGENRDERADDTLRIRVLGQVEVERDGTVHVVRAPKPCSILVALSLAAPRMVTVEELYEVVWGDVVPDSAAKTFQNYVSRLRRLVGDRAIRFGGTGYVLTTDPEAIDARQFESAVRGARRLLEDGEERVALAQLDVAEGLWRGRLGSSRDTPAGQGLIARFDELRRAQREMLAEARLRTGEEVVALLESAVVEDPTRERLWELLVRALRRDARVADGLRAYQRACSALAEIGLTPGPSLRAAERGLLVTTATTPGGAGRSVRPLPSALDRDDELPMVERGEQLALLTRLWEAARNGRSSAVVLIGAAGAGKSRLAAAAAARAHADGADVALGVSREDHVRPYDVVLAPLLALADAQHRAELERLLGADGVAGAGAFERVADERWRAELNAACLDVVTAATNRVPVALVIEDIHWADASSVRLLQFVIARAEGRLLTVVTTRPEGTARREIAELVADAHRRPHAAVADVPMLSVTAIDHLLSATSVPPDDATSAETASAIHSVTAGNAFLVTEVLRDGLVGRGIVVPRAVQDVVRSRVTRLSDRAHLTIVAASVCGEHVDAQLLAGVRGIELPAALAELDDLVRAGFLTEDDVGSYRFLHDLTRQAVYGSAPKARRAELHLSAARTVRASGRSAADVAHHLLFARPLASADETLEWVRRAATEAAERRGLHEAVTWMSRAVALEAELPAVRDRRARLLFEFGVLLSVAGDTERSAEVFFEAADLADDPLLLAEIAIANSGSPVGSVERTAGRSRALLRRAKTELPAEAISLRCRLTYEEIGWMVLDEDPAPRLAAARDVTELARSTGDPLLHGLALNAAWSAGLGMRDHVEQRQLSEAAWVQLHDRASGLLNVSALLRVWTDRVAVGCIADARAAATEMRDRAERLASDSIRWYADLLDAFHAFFDGDMDAASAWADAAEALPTSRAAHAAMNLAQLRARIAGLNRQESVMVEQWQRVLDVVPAFRDSPLPAMLTSVRAGGDAAGPAIDTWAMRSERIPARVRSEMIAGIAPYAARFASKESLRLLRSLLERERGYWLANFVTLPRGRAETALGYLRAGLGDLDGAIEDIATAHSAHVAAGTWGLAAESGAAMEEVRSWSAAQRRRSLRVVR